MNDASEAEMEDSTADCDTEIEDRTEASEASMDEAAVVTGTGTTVTPLEPLDVLSV